MQIVGIKRRVIQFARRRDGNVRCRTSDRAIDGIDGERVGPHAVRRETIGRRDVEVDV